jgi:hypothetical protein
MMLCWDEVKVLTRTTVKEQENDGHFLKNNAIADKTYNSRVKTEIE